MVFAFHPKLKLDRIVVFCSFQQKENEIFDLSHPNDQMLEHVDHVSLMQLKDAAVKVLKKESPFALSEMFSIKLKFTIDLLVSWFNKTHKSRF